MTGEKQPHFVAAALGYWRIELVRRAGELKVYREPIIGWELRPGVDLPNVNYFAHPVTVAWSPKWLSHAADQARAQEEV
jgi:hypothetical protein